MLIKLISTFQVQCILWDSVTFQKAVIIMTSKIKSWTVNENCSKTQDGYILQT